MVKIGLSSEIFDLNKPHTSFVIIGNRKDSLQTEDYQGIYTNSKSIRIYMFQNELGLCFKYGK